MDKHSFPLQEEATEWTSYINSLFPFLSFFVLQSQAAFFNPVKHKEKQRILLNITVIEPTTERFPLFQFPFLGQLLYFSAAEISI